MSKRILFISIFISCLCHSGRSQDPHFSQFFMAPQFINPAQMGNFEGAWRIMGNFRQQWGLAETPFTTAVCAGEMKVFGFEEFNKTLAVGGALMYDQSMFGAFKSNYAVVNIGYHTQLDDYNRLGIGFHGMYANRRIDFSALSFGEQFTSIDGFDAAALNGETNLVNPRPYLSMGAGLMYNFSDLEKFQFGIGASVFHLNQPKQSFLADKDWIIPMRYVGHAHFNYNMNEFLVMNLYGIFQYQSKPSYFSAGGTLGMDISGGNQSSMLYAGGWFREGDAFYPYVGLLVNKVQVGFSYDITHSKQIYGPSVPQTFEMSFVIRGDRQDPQRKQFMCPWN